MTENKNDKINMVDNSVVNVAVYLYLMLIFGVYPWIMDDKYFNITITRYKFFTTASMIFVLVVFFGYATEYFVMRYSNRKKLFIYKDDIAFYKKPDFWMIMFLASNLFAWIVSEDKKLAFTGESGRYMGLYIYLAATLVFLFIANNNNVVEPIFALFAITVFFSYVVAIFQHLGIDFMGYRDGISQKQYDIFMSTFGNINIFASFLALSIPVFVCLFVFSDEVFYKIISGVVLVGGGMSLMIANSDSGYFGALVACVFIFFMAFYHGRTVKYLLAMLCLAVGNLGVVLLNKCVIKNYDKRGGVAEAMDRLDLAILIILALAFVCLIIYILKNVGILTDSINRKRAIIIMAGVLIFALVVFVLYGVTNKKSLFVFNYKWGTYRGYIWTKCVELFKDAPVINKLFGYGNESVKSLMLSNFSIEMKEITGKTYDNAHNELLQYLLTTGLLGLISYIGLVVSSFVYILKRCANNLVAYVSLAAVTGYFFQSLINLNQPITTPFIFVFMALGIGNVRNKYS